MEESSISDFKVLMRGQLTVNLPVLLLTFLIFMGFLMFTTVPYHLISFIAITIAWFFWSFLVKKWILWAKSKNISDERILKIGKQGLLVWSMNTIETVTVKNKMPWF